MTITMYGIRNCDTVRAARKWLKDREIDYRFVVSFRADRLQPSTVQDWFDRAGWRTVLNTASTGFGLCPMLRRQPSTRPAPAP